MALPRLVLRLVAGSPAFGRLTAWCLTLLAIGFLSGSCRPERGEAPGGNEGEPEPFFVDVALEAGLDFVHENGATGHYYYPELLQGGIAVLDFDGDGFLDVYLVQSGPLPAQPETDLNANRLYHNRGDGTFVEVTAVSGTGDRGYGSGAAVADYDGDGRVDLYVTNLGPNTLYRNGGDGTFSAVTASAGVGDPGYSTSALFLDYDRDGDLDLYVCNYLDWSVSVERPCLGANGRLGYCSPLEYDRPQPDRLYRNEGDGTFRDVSEEAGIHAARGTGLGVVSADFDGDGWLDIYVANDQMANFLWINNGDGSFREEALLRGCALNEDGLPEASMGVSTEDYDDDGDWDIFVAHLTGETNTFYRNEGGHFRDVTDELGLGSISKAYTGFGTSLFDYDNDGVYDIFLANGKVRPGASMTEDYREPNQLLRGGADGRFHDVSAQAGDALSLVEVSRGTVFADYDNDGDVDLVFINNDGPVRLLRNEVGSQRHWLEVQLEGHSPNTQGIGARVTVQVGQRTRRRLVQPAHSYCTSNDVRVAFGLGDHASVDRLTVTWPSGAEQELRDVAADQLVVLDERSASAR